MSPAGPLLVTGAAGFIGSHLCRALVDRGVRVVGVDDYHPFYDRSLKEANVAGLDRKRFSLHEIDIRDRSAMAQCVERERPRCVFHFAALAGVRPSIERPAEYVSVNVDGLVSVLDAARASGCRRFVFASSSSVYGDAERVPFSEESDASRPISPYAATKRAGELICHAYAHLFGLSCAVVRLFTVYGPRQRPDLAIARFMRLIAAGEPIERYGDGSTSRDYTYVGDVIEGVLSAAERVDEHALRSEAGFHRIWNLGHSEPVSLAETIEQVARVVGRNAQIREVEMQPGDVRRTCADLTRSRAELGYDPRTPFAEGLARQWEAAKGR